MGESGIPIFFDDSPFWSVVVIVAPMAVLGLIWVYLSTTAQYASIKSHVAQRGGKVVSVAWEPFMGKGSETVYKIRYLDQAEVLHEAFCRIGVFSDPYLTFDRIVPYSDGTGKLRTPESSKATVAASGVAAPLESPTDMNVLLRENLSLRRENEQLRQDLWHARYELENRKR